MIARTVVLLMIAGVAQATGTMRCATHVIDQGMTKAEIIGYCGEPALRKDDDTYW